MYVYLNHLAIHLKLTQYCKLTTIFKKKSWPNSGLIGHEYNKRIVTIIHQVWGDLLHSIRQPETFMKCLLCSKDFFFLHSLTAFTSYF